METAMNLQSRPDIPPLPMTIDQFFDWAAQQERRYELVDGVPEVLPFVKRNHSRIVSNLLVGLSRQIDRASFEVATGDFAVATGPRSIRYADVIVEKAGGGGEERMTEHAILLVEVLSPSTRRVDFGPKTREYLALSSLDTYLILDQEKRKAWQWTRDHGGRWPENAKVFDDANTVLTLASIGAQLSFDEIYRSVSGLPAPPADDRGAPNDR